MEPQESRPFRLDRPVRQTVPFAFASPHSGRSYPQSLLARTRLDATTLPTADKHHPWLGRFVTLRRAKAGEVFRGVAFAPEDGDDDRR